MAEGKLIEIRLDSGARYKLEESYPEGWRNSLAAFNDSIELRNRYFTVKPGDIVIDVASEFGIFSLHAIASGAKMVYAFEPNEKIRPYLKNNIVINKFQENFHNNGHSLDIDKFIDNLSVTPEHIDWIVTGRLSAENCRRLLQMAINTINKYHPKIIVSSEEDMGGILLFFDVNVKGANITNISDNHWLISF